MISTRLHKQGFINLHRKLLFRLIAIMLFAYLFFAPAQWELPAPAVLCMQVAGTLFLFMGIIGRSLATLSIGGHKDHTIIRTELYSICRNPLYFASFLMAIGIGLLTGRVDFLILITAFYLVIFYPMMINEARFLRERFSEFADYEKLVPLFFPNFSLWQERGKFEINFRLVKRTLFDAFVALPAIPIMILFKNLIDK